VQEIFLKLFLGLTWHKNCTLLERWSTSLTLDKATDLEKLTYYAEAYGAYQEILEDDVSNSAIRAHVLFLAYALNRPEKAEGFLKNESTQSVSWLVSCVILRLLKEFRDSVKACVVAGMP